MSRAFAKYQPFIERVRGLTRSQTGKSWKLDALAALNGQAGSELEKLVAVTARRKVGAFFTNHVLADRLLAGLDFGQAPVIYDPACGAGDLLLAAARILGSRRTLSDTGILWRTTLRGTDRVARFVEAAKARLMLQARVFHPRSVADTEAEFGSISVSDAMNEAALIAAATHVVMNPPFVRHQAPASCEWTSGKVNSAALFVEHALQHMATGAHLLAILPEVLRTGSRYAKWRQMVSSKAGKLSAESAGLFPGSADVDVFLLRLVRGESSKTHQCLWADAEIEHTVQRTLSDYFIVSVGPVVPYRDPHEGSFHPFAHPRNVPAWTSLSEIGERRRWMGRLVTPPFVVLRRTSRPGDQFRATASVIRCKEPVAVENHLIVCAPKDGTLATCRKLMRHLRAEVINRHLDKEMRCRHLTVGSVRQIPLPDAFDKND